MTTTPLTHAPYDSGAPASARDFAVEDRVVIITGSGQGIGRELARQFAAAGARVVVADLDLDKAGSVVREIGDAGGSRAGRRGRRRRRVVRRQRWSATVIDNWGRIDVLINNASIFATLEKKPFDQIPVSQWETVLRVNITGTYLCVRAVAEHMRQAGFGRIINVSSDAVTRGTVNYLHYVTSKSAVIGMTNSLARELGPYGITVNCIRPGSVATEVERAVNPTVEVRERAASLQCIPRGMVPTDLVGIMLFLAADASAFITGQTIACDGGYTHNS